MSKQSHGHRYMTGNEVREAFVKFFESKNHRELASSSLVPHNDPTVLLTTAGMQQMTPFFLGLETPPHNRLCSVQKCFRTVDIDEVGDESHCTFFFMLGNFSIGDYFKRESLAWSWEFLTEVMGLPADRLYPTVHTDDQESFEIWRDEIGVPEERIEWLEDNWWGPVGPTGPNGPVTGEPSPFRHGAVPAMMPSGTAPCGRPPLRSLPPKPRAGRTTPLVRPAAVGQKATSVADRGPAEHPRPREPRT